jgi:hypothetical protein
MNLQTQLLLTLIMLGLVDVVIPIPIIGLTLIYVVLKRPPWFLRMVREIYGPE